MWNNTLTQIFENSKQILVNKVKEGIQSFDFTWKTCLRTCWSKEGIGYLLEQYCDCPTSLDPEGEMFAVAWSSDYDWMFVLGCTELVVSTDHKPLSGIFNNCGINSIVSPHISNLKQKTLRYHFTTQYNPGEWNRGADACSWNPVDQPIICSIYNKPSSNDISASEKIEQLTASTIQTTITKLFINEQISSLHHTEPTNMITLEIIQNVCHNDPQYQQLLNTVITGFPDKWNDTPPIVKEY